MTDFRVGDWVRYDAPVEGVVIRVNRGDCFIRDGVGNTHLFPTSSLALIERPKPKLRIGSVWHPDGCPEGRYMVIGYSESGSETFMSLQSGLRWKREDLTYDTARSPWREVSVDELQREAQA